MPRFRNCLALVSTLVTMLVPVRLLGVTCTTQAQMNDGQRNALMQVARTLGSEVQSGNVAAVQAATIPKVKA